MVAFATAFFLFCAAVGRASTMKLVSGGRVLPEEYSPVHTAAGFMVPVDLATLFGGTVTRRGDEWIVQKGIQAIRFRPGVREAVVGERTRELPSEPIRVEDQLYVPLRFLGDFLGLKISVSGNTLEITPWSALTVQRTPGSQSPLPAPAAGGINAFLIAPPLLEGGRAPTEGLTGAEAAAGSAFGDAIESPADEPASDDREAPVPFLLPRPGIARVETAPPTPVEERFRSISEAITRLLAQLTPSAGSEQKLEPSEWVALRRATGLALSVVDEDGLRRYRFAGDTGGVTTAHLVAPPRIVVDFPAVRGANLDPYVPEDPAVERIRAVDRDGSLRLIFDLAVEVGHRLEAGEDGATLVLFRPLTKVDVDADPQGGRIRLDVPGNTPYKISRLSEPDRIVIDLMDTTLVGGAVVVGPLKGPIAQVRAAQFQPDVARIVLDVGEETPVELASTRGALMLSYGDQRGIVAYRIPGEREFHVAVAAPENARVSVYRLFQPDRLVMDVTGVRLAAPLQDALFLEGPVSRLRTSQYDENTVRVVADLRFHVRYAVKEEGDRRVLVMEQPLLAGRTVTVDAGHGGYDGGAVGVRRGVLEKEINLDIARRLERLLTGAEATVHMTRVDDTFVDLWARADLANETESDLLVSIHANSAPDNTVAKGTETYVRTGEPLSEWLGLAIQRSLTSALGTVDRGVRPNRYLVVRRAAMPAALVEVAFLADPEEEALLAEEWFRERAAEGIFNGILRYFYPDDELEPDWADENARDLPWNRLLEQAAPGQAAP